MKGRMTACLLGACLCASAAAQQTPTVKRFLEELVRAPHKMPEYKKAPEVVDQIAPMRQCDVREVSPVIFTALSYPQDAVKLHAALALYAVSRRPDSYVLLEPRLKEILSLLERGDQRYVRGAAIHVIGRYGKKGVVRASEQLSKVAANPDERPDVRQMAERLLAKQ